MPVDSMLAKRKHELAYTSNYFYKEFSKYKVSNTIKNSNIRRAKLKKPPEIIQQKVDQSGPDNEPIKQKL